MFQSENQSAGLQFLLCYQKGDSKKKKHVNACSRLRPNMNKTLFRSKDIIFGFVWVWSRSEPKGGLNFPRIYRVISVTSHAKTHLYFWILKCYTGRQVLEMISQSKILSVANTIENDFWELSCSFLKFAATKWSTLKIKVTHFFSLSVNTNLRRLINKGQRERKQKAKL